MKKIKSLPKVLIIEASKASADTVSVSLGGQGYQQCYASSFAEAISKIQDQDYALLLVNFDIIRDNIKQAVTQLKANASPCPVIAICEHTDSIIYDQLTQAGVDGYIIKNDSFNQMLPELAQTVIGNFHRVKVQTQINMDHQEIELNLQQIFNAAPPLSVIDKNHQIIFANPNFCKHFNVDPEKLRTMKCWQVHKTNKCHTNQCPLQKSLRGIHTNKYETTMQCGNNISKHVILNISPYRNANNEIIGIATSITDIHERKVVEKKLLRYQEQLKMMASDLAAAEEMQRKKIAEDLHDSIGQNLALAQIKLDMLNANLKDKDSDGQIKEIRDIIQQTIKDTHTLIFEISPPILYKIGLGAALQWLCENIEQNHGLSCHCQTDNNCPEISDKIRTILFRAARELMINCVKHAKAKDIWVNLKSDHKHLILTVQDNGAGFKSSQEPQKETGGFGLFNISERISSVGGALTIGTSKNQKTEIKLILPISVLK
ncbi:MAG: PAS domain S-box protein [Phycisphaerae bacterium]|nr:PAS domain S-box protein [Phycisphaerae bacterium]